MTYNDFVDRLNKAHLSIREFAELVCTHKNSFTNCAKTNHVADHWGIVATLIVEMEKKDVDFRGPLRGLEIQPKKMRGAAAKGKFGGDTRQPDIKNLFEPER